MKSQPLSTSASCIHFYNVILSVPFDSSGFRHISSKKFSTFKRSLFIGLFALELDELELDEVEEDEDDAYAPADFASGFSIRAVSFFAVASFFRLPFRKLPKSIFGFTLSAFLSFSFACGSYEAPGCPATSPALVVLDLEALFSALPFGCAFESIAPIVPGLPPTASTSSTCSSLPSYSQSSRSRSLGLALVEIF